MKLTRTKKVLALVAFVLVAGAAVAWYATRPEPPDTRFTGAYRFDDGRLAIVTPREGPTLRLRIPATGESLPLFPVGEPGELRFAVGTGWSERTPAQGELRFRMEPDGRPRGFAWTAASGGGGERAATRIDLPEARVWIRSGDLRLRAKLVSPLSPGPHPAVVLVHGSEAYSAVDFYPGPYLYAAHGIATLVYDKRGTGGSEGTYTQNFHVLARDVVAAVAALRARSDVDPSRIQLEGGSQGGWIAPLAAAEDGHIRSLLIDYGPMVPVAQENRWGYVYQLREKGLGDDAIHRADKLNDALNEAFRGTDGAWDDLGRALDAARGTDWFAAAKGSDSTIGFLATHPRVPLWALHLYAWWKLRPVDGAPFIERLYDPVPTLAGLEVPSLWIFGGEDHSMPTRWSMDRLEKLQAAGRPIRILLYPHADHGIVRFRDLADGSRRRLGYEPTYMAAQVAWLRYQSGLDPALDLPPGAPALR